MLVYEYIFWIFFYSVAGWIYESILCSVCERRLINRGFLNGPYCPVYGFGAALNILILGGIENIFALFSLGAIIACVLEYFTSWLLEKLFQARWWDYSKHKFNLNGRICLLGAVVFGTFSVLLLRMIHPKVVLLTNTLSDLALAGTALSILVIFAADCSYTVVNVLGFNKKLRLAEIRLELPDLRQQLSEVKSDIRANLPQLPDVKSDIKLHLQQLSEVKSTVKLNLQERRLLRAFPKLKSDLYDDVLQLVKEAFETARKKKK